MLGKPSGLPYEKRLEIARRLKAELDKARDEHSAATARFDQLAEDTPSGLPHPDGSLRIRQAGKSVTASLENYTRTLKRFTDFAVSGIVPEDILPPPPAAT